MENMYLSIKIHDLWKNGANVLLHEVRPCPENEFYEILAQYERREGKYGMKNVGLDHCHWITEDMAKHRMKFIKG